jgi:two-component system sensor histidine kinase HydH
MRLVQWQRLVPRGIAEFFRPEDLAWLLIFAALAAFGPDLNYSADLVLLAFALFQVAEPKIRLLSSPRGQLVAIMIKIVLSYLLIGFSHALDSSYFLILLVPVITAATTLDLIGTLIFSLISAMAYLSFLAFVDWQHEYLPPDQVRVLALRALFIAVVGYLVYLQARGKRLEMERTRQAAAQLAESNRVLRSTQASLRRSERLAALGQLTAGLAHELRNPLGTIKASAELLVKPSTHTRPEIMQELAGYIVTEVDRTNSLVARFLDFARPLRLEPKESDICEVTRHTIAPLRQRAGSKDVELATELPSEPLVFSFDPDLYELALTNLVQNAIDASSAGSTVCVTVRHSEEDVTVVIKDSGTGIAPDQMENIFNPFFTTKAQGTGLGLAIVAKIVDEHGGTIRVQSTPGKGTTFQLHLPQHLEV